MANLKLEDPDFPEEERPENVLPAPMPLRVLGKVVKIAFWVFVLAVNGFLFWRMFSSGLPEDMKILWADGELREAYAAYLADPSEEKEPFGVYQKVCLKNNITVDDPEKDEDGNTVKPGNYGYFSMEDQALFPTAHQAQVVFRYNRSTLEHLKEDYALPFDPDRSEEWYIVRLRYRKDLTPDNRDDSAFEVGVLEGDMVESDEKNIYCYRKWVFRNLPDLADVYDIYADVYYKDDASPDKEEAYGSVCIYSQKYVDSAYKLDKKDKAALSG